MILTVRYDNGLSAATHAHLGLTELQAAVLKTQALEGDERAIAEVRKRMEVVVQQLATRPAMGSC